MICKNCNNEIKDGLQFCPFCGEGVEEKKQQIFCANCGTEVLAGVQFCPNCGKKLDETTSRKKLDFNSETNALSGMSATAKKRISFLAVGVGILLVCVLLFGGRSYKKVVDTYVNASMKADAKAIWTLLPKKMREAVIEEAEEEEYLSGEKEFIEYLGDELQDKAKSLDDKLGEKWKISYEIVNIEDYEGADVREYVREIREEGIEDFQASAVKKVEVELTIKSKDGETEVSQSMYITLVKIGRKWYLGTL